MALTTTTLVRPANPSTVVVHFRLDTTSNRTIFNVGGRAGQFIGWFPKLDIEDTSAWSTYSMSASTTFYTLAVVFDGANSQAYLNGTSIGSFNLGSAVGVGDTLRIGTYGVEGHYPFDGAIDGLLYYNRALSASECASSPNWFN